VSRAHTWLWILAAASYPVNAGFSLQAVIAAESTQLRLFFHLCPSAVEGYLFRNAFTSQPSVCPRSAVHLPGLLLYWASPARRLTRGDDGFSAVPRTRTPGGACPPSLAGRVGLLRGPLRSRPPCGRTACGALRIPDANRDWIVSRRIRARQAAGRDPSNS
jgi:hypothetical protein